MAENASRQTTGAAPRPRPEMKDVGLWAEPLHFAPRSRAQFWDAENAGWRSGPAVPSPRAGD
jgi:hypothetical protein